MQCQNKELREGLVAVEHEVGHFARQQTGKQTEKTKQASSQPYPAFEFDYASAAAAALQARAAKAPAKAEITKDKKMKQ